LISDDLHQEIGEIGANRRVTIREPHHIVACDGLNNSDSWLMRCMNAVHVSFSRAHMPHTTTFGASSSTFSLSWVAKTGLPFSQDSVEEWRNTEYYCPPKRGDPL
jgi:hypothetical protein